MLKFRIVNKIILLFVIVLSISIYINNTNCAFNAIKTCTGTITFENYFNLFVAGETNLKWQNGTIKIKNATEYSQILTYSDGDNYLYYKNINSIIKNQTIINYITLNFSDNSTLTFNGTCEILSTSGYVKIDKTNYYNFINVKLYKLNNNAWKQVKLLGGSITYGNFNGYKLNFEKDLFYIANGFLIK